MQLLILHQLVDSYTYGVDDSVEMLIIISPKLHHCLYEFHKLLLDGIMP